MKEENSCYRAYLGDVGVSKKFSSQTSFNKRHHPTSIVGTCSWMAPEMKIQEKPSSSRDDKIIDYRKLDVFSLGLISLFCLDTEDSFSEYHLELNESNRKLQEEYLPRLKSRMPIEFYLLLKSMLSFDESSRPSIDELVQHSLDFQGLNLFLL